MNTPAVDPREWELQERALREERDALGNAASDPDVAQYRVVARALRQPPDAGPPADFARSVAMRAVQAAVPAEPWLEVWLLRGLGLALGGAALFVSVKFGQSWFDSVAPLLDTTRHATTLNWMLALLACVGVSWSLDRARALGSSRR